MMPADLPFWAALPIALLLIAGSLLALIGSAGLLRLPDFHARMHAPTLGSSLGLGCVLAASLIAAGVQGQRLVLQEILIAVLMLTTSPVSTILLMQAGIYRKRDHVDHQGQCSDE
jgi:multicomponent K+:H+ antiporter subunit G